MSMSLAYRCVRWIRSGRNFCSSAAGSRKVPEYRISYEPAVFTFWGFAEYLSRGLEKKIREEDDLYLASKRLRQELRELRVQHRLGSLPKLEE